MKKSTKRFRRLKKHHKNSRKEKAKNCQCLTTKRYKFKCFWKKNPAFIWEEYIDVCTECGRVVDTSICNLPTITRITAGEEKIIIKMIGIVNNVKKKHGDSQFIHLVPIPKYKYVEITSYKVSLLKECRYYLT